MAALLSAVEIGFSDPFLQYQVHMSLHSLYLEQHALDLALDHLQAAEAALDGTPPVGAKQEEERRVMKQGIEGRRKSLDATIKHREREFAAKMALAARCKKPTSCSWASGSTSPRTTAPSASRGA